MFKKSQHTENFHLTHCFKNYFQINFKPEYTQSETKKSLIDSFLYIYCLKINRECSKICVPPL